MKAGRSAGQAVGRGASRSRTPLAAGIGGTALDLKQNQLSGFHNSTADGADRGRASATAAGLRGTAVPSGQPRRQVRDRHACQARKARRVDDRPALREIRSVFASEGKGNAIAALKLIERMLSRQKAGDPEALAALVEALRHAHADVQSQALDMIEKHADGLDQARLDGLRDVQKPCFGQQPETALGAARSCRPRAARCARGRRYGVDRNHGGGGG